MARKIRLAVGSPDELHSSVWSIWTQGDELYAAQRTAQGLMKVSVHSSGVCLHAFTTESGVKGGRSDDSRVIDRWKIPAVGEDPFTVCLQLIVPSVFIPLRFTADDLPASRRASVRWLAPAYLGHQRVVLFVRALSREQRISEFLTGDFEVLDTLDLRSGGVVWVLSYTEVLPAADATWWQTQVSEFKVDVQTQEDADGMNMMVLTTGAHQHPYPAIRHISLGRNNVRLANDI